jgi:hypothetical protein
MQGTELVFCLVHSSTSTEHKPTFCITCLLFLERYLDRIPSGARQFYFRDISCSIFKQVSPLSGSSFINILSSQSMTNILCSLHNILNTQNNLRKVLRPSILLSTIPTEQSWTFKSASIGDVRCRQELRLSSSYVVHIFFCRWQNQTHTAVYAILRRRC